MSNKMVLLRWCDMETGNTHLFDIEWGDDHDWVWVKWKDTGPILPSRYMEITGAGRLYWGQSQSLTKAQGRLLWRTVCSMEQVEVLKSGLAAPLD